MSNDNTSLLGKQWEMRCEETGLDVKERIFQARGLEREEFLCGKIESMPGLEKMLGSEDVITRIKKAVSSGGRIMIFGDYDVDGITSTVILFEALRKLGAVVSVRLPHRVEHGYGLRAEVFDECVQHKVGLLVTVDCGISNKNEIAYGNSLGVDTVVIDHHTCPAELPEAAGIIDPKQEGETYPCTELVAAGLAYLVAKKLLEDLPEKEKVLKHALALAAVGTIADCAPLLGVNRIMVKEGLAAMRDEPHCAMRALAAVAGLDIAQVDAGQIGFVIGPRINAAGRLDDPILAFDLLRGKVKNAEKLEKLNAQRKLMTREAMEEAEELRGKSREKKLIFLYKPEWHVGVVGLIAGRLAEESGLPVFVMCKKDTEVVGSARTPRSFYAAEALRENGDVLMHFGGHHEAAGFSLLEENLEEFEQRLQVRAEKIYKNAKPVPVLIIDTFLNEKEVNKDLWNLVDEFEPCGVGNEQPVFLIQKANLRMVQGVGSAGAHLKMRVECNVQSYDVLGWNMGKLVKMVSLGEEYDLVVKTRKNEWQGKTSLEFEVLDLKKSV